MEGGGADARPAAAVVSTITAAGGTAVGDTSDISTPAGAEACIAAAVERYGRIDVLINNAGIIRWAGPPDADAANLAAHLDIHVGGSFHTARAAWPHMAAQGYGRVVMTTSSGLFGLPDNLSYATAKAGVIGLTRSLATAGAPHGIKVNAIAPAALTRMAAGPAEQAAPPAPGGAGGPAAPSSPPAASPTVTAAPSPPAASPTVTAPLSPPAASPAGGGAAAMAQMSPALVAPMAVFLAHEACPVTGEVYAAGGGRFARVFIGVTEGYLSAAPTLEDVAAHWAAINDEPGYSVPTDLAAWSARFLRHLG